MLVKADSSQIELRIAAKHDGAFSNAQALLCIEYKLTEAQFSRLVQRGNRPPILASIVPLRGLITAFRGATAFIRLAAMCLATAVAPHFQMVTFASRPSIVLVSRRRAIRVIAIPTFAAASVVLGRQVLRL